MLMFKTFIFFLKKFKYNPSKRGFLLLIKLIYLEIFSILFTGKFIDEF